MQFQDSVSDLRSFIISETGQHVDKCPHGPSFQRMSPFILRICILAQPWVGTVHDTAKYNSVPPVPDFSSFAPESSLVSSLLPPSDVHFEDRFSLGLIQGLHLQFSFTKQKNILLERNGIKEKWFSNVLEAGHRQDLICYVQLESALVRSNERGV